MPQAISSTDLAEVRKRLQRQLEPSPSDTDLSFALGQSNRTRHAADQLAAEYGFLTWKQLEAYFQTEPTSDQDRFQLLACLNYRESDSPARWGQAALMLEQKPSLGTNDLYSAACIGDVATVHQQLNEDPTRINQRGGVFDWQPLLYACYSRLEGRAEKTRDVVRLLVDRGADVNAFYMWGGQYRFTALTGVFGQGEAGTKSCPAHKEWESVARCLLGAGADPNDSQALYNRMFDDPQHHCLRLLLEYGLNRTHRCNWLIQEGDQLKQNPQSTLQYQLRYAIKNRLPERVDLLLQHRVNVRPNHPQAGNEASIVELALVTGQPEVAEKLVAAGAAAVELPLTSQLAAACMAGNREQVERLVADHVDLLKSLLAIQPEILHQAASNSQTEAIRLLVSLGADIDDNPRSTPLHEACWVGDKETVQLLLELGANPTITDLNHRATPEEWARHAGHDDVADFLAGQNATGAEET